MKTRLSSRALLVVFTVLGPPVATSEADDHGRSIRPSKDVVLYELMENAEFADFVVLPDGRQVPTTRLGRSALQGKANPGTPLCPRVLLDQVFPDLPFHIRETKRCVVTATGDSNLSLLSDSGILRGTINGNFAVVLNTVETNLTDAAELVVMSGIFSGAIEVRDPVIITILGGTFRPMALIGGLGQPAMCAGLGICDATFTGKFRLPFKVRHHAVYKQDSGRLVRVLADERALGDPTVRLEVTFD